MHAKHVEQNTRHMTCQTSPTIGRHLTQADLFLRLLLMLMLVGKVAFMPPSVTIPASHLVLPSGALSIQAGLGCFHVSKRSSKRGGFCRAKMYFDHLPVLTTILLAGACPSGRAVGTRTWVVLIILRAGGLILRCTHSNGFAATGFQRALFTLLTKAR